MSSPPSTARAPSARRRPRPPVRGQMLRNMPVTLRYGVPLLLLVLAVLGLLELRPKTLAVQAIGFQGIAFDPKGLVADLYPYDGTGAGEYPPRAIGRVEFGDDGTHSLRVDTLGGGAGQLVASVPGHGIAWTQLDPTRQGAQLEFGTPMRMEGKITRAGDVGIPRAHVQVLSDRYGALLAEATCDEFGNFAVEGLSSSSTFYALRMRAEGFALRTEDVQVVPDAPLALRLTSTRPVTGRVEVPAGVEVAGLELRAFRVPGLRANVLADGAFYVDHLPPAPARVRLLVAGLPDGYTHPTTVVSAGEQDVVLRVGRASRVRGFVVRADNDAPVPGAYVAHTCGPRGEVGAYAQANGAFELGMVPAGTVRFEAFAESRHVAPVAPGAEARTQVLGFVEVDVVEGVDRTDVVVRVN